MTVAILFLFVADQALGPCFPRHSLADVAFRLVDPTLRSLSIALALLVVVAGNPGLLFRLLNGRLPVHIGRISYSLYIWQELILFQGAASSSLFVLLRVFAAYVVSLCSFTFFERSFVRLRSRFRHGVAV